MLMAAGLDQMELGIKNFKGGHWMQNANGWWYEDESGWYPQNQYVWIDGVNYFFGADGFCK